MKNCSDSYELRTPPLIYACVPEKLWPFELPQPIALSWQARKCGFCDYADLFGAAPGDRACVLPELGRTP
jgi:hypothetical protein